MQALAYTQPDADDADEAPDPLDVSSAHLDALSEEWAAWCRTRRFFGRVSVPVSLLGKLRSPERGRYSGGPNAPNSPELAAFHLAVLGQPPGRDKWLFELQFLYRAPNITAAAEASGISRAHWYRLVRAFQRRAYAVSRDILAANLAAGDALASQRKVLCTVETRPPRR